jgi:hypothetical protein
MDAFDALVTPVSVKKRGREDAPAEEIGRQTKIYGISASPLVSEDGVYEEADATIKRWACCAASRGAADCLSLTHTRAGMG